MDTLTIAFDTISDGSGTDAAPTSPDARLRPRRQPGYSVESLFETLDIGGAVYEPVIRARPVGGGQTNV